MKKLFFFMVFFFSILNANILWHSNHYDQKTETFYNPWEEPPFASYVEFIKFWVHSRPEWPAQIEIIPTKPLASVESELHITNIGHATLLIQVGGINILTDPVYAQTVSPWSFLGPKRVKQPGVRFEDLPKIDLVLISHNHFDHMDIDFLQKLNDRDHPQIITGLGNSAYLRENNIENSTDLDWWQTQEFNTNLKITAVPAQHWSQRTVFDQNATLWVGFVIETSKGKIYFAGDTGWGPHFEEIAEKFAPFCISLIPIGAAYPRRLMQNSHIGPEEAVNIHKILKAKFSIPIHFDVFHLAAEAYGEVKIDLINTLIKEKIHKDSFPIIEVGEKFIIP